VNFFYFFSFSVKRHASAHPYRDMKNLIFLAAVILCGAAGGVSASPQVNWGLLWSGSWEEKTFTAQDFQALSGTLRNRGEFKFHFLPQEDNLKGFFSAFSLRGQVLDRHSLDFGLDPPSAEGITHFMGGLYHRLTGSRILYGVLDEWGLSARIRNPWIRSPAYAENHKPLMADLKTAVSSTKEDEVYLYLSTPNLTLAPDIKLRVFVSAQTEAKEFTPAVSGGVDLSFLKNSNILLETFYTGGTLAKTKGKSWFSSPPPLPEREFHLYSAAILYSNPLITASSDFAFSETYAWGEGIYANFGITVTPLLPLTDKGFRPRPLAISLAVDGAGDYFVSRDGSNLSAGFRGAAKIEWKGRFNSLIRLDSVLRGPGIEEGFNRSSAGFYYRFPANAAIRRLPVRPTRISLSASRNSVNPKKINDSYSGTIGLSLNLWQKNTSSKLSRQLAGSPLGITLSGTYREITTAKESPFLYPVPSGNWDSASINCELYWSPFNLQLRSRFGVSIYPEKEEKWELSLSATVRFKYFRFTLKAASPDLPEKWNWTITWRLEKPEKK